MGLEVWEEVLEGRPRTLIFARAGGVRGVGVVLAHLVLGSLVMERIVVNSLV